MKINETNDFSTHSEYMYRQTGTLAIREDPDQ